MSHTATADFGPPSCTHLVPYPAYCPQCAAAAGTWTSPAVTWNVGCLPAALVVPPDPVVTDLVHYVSHGSPVREDGTQAYPATCRAAIVTQVPKHLPPATESAGARPNGADGTWLVSLRVFNPSGDFWNEYVRFDAGTFTGPARETAAHGWLRGEPLPQVTCDDLTFGGGTWHHRPARQ